MELSRSNKGGMERAARSEDEKEGLVGRIRRWMAESAWGSLAGKGLITLAGFALLALVGSGTLRWPSPHAPAPVTLGIAEASAAPPPSALPSASARVEAAPAPVASALAKLGPPIEETPPGDGGAAATAGVSADGKVILNLATEEDLRRLPSIGATRAKAILALRTRLGHFSRVEDLLKVKGIGRRSLARLRPLVLIDPR